MPLSSGKGKGKFKKNVKQLVHDYEDTGKIGTSKPKSKKKAVKQALAISYVEQKKKK